MLRNLDDNFLCICLFKELDAGPRPSSPDASISMHVMGFGVTWNHSKEGSLGGTFRQPEDVSVGLQGPSRCRAAVSRARLGRGKSILHPGIAALHPAPSAAQRHHSRLPRSARPAALSKTSAATLCIINGRRHHVCSHAQVVRPQPHARCHRRRRRWRRLRRHQLCPRQAARCARAHEQRPHRQGEVSPGPPSTIEAC